MHEREGGELQEVIDYNHQRDLDNRERYMSLYGIDIFDHSGVDWIFDTSYFTLEEVVEQVCQRITELESRQPEEQADKTNHNGAIL
jgi:cytidylate kinase